MSFQVVRIGLVAALTLAFGCAPSQGPGGKGQPAGQGAATGAGGGIGLPGAGGGGTLPPGAGGAIFGIGGNMGTSGNSGGPPDACGAVSQEPEQVTVYVDATVTDTIVTYTPIALYIMQDRSSSMVGVAGDPSRWPNSQNAINTFVNDSASTGLDVGIGFFPPMSATFDGATQGECSMGADCGRPVVPIASLPNNASAITNAFQAATPPTGFGSPIFLTPTECAIRGMINECLRFESAAGGEQCVAVLVTDGEPTLCNTDPTFLRDIVAQGAAAGIPTFAVALPGSNINFMRDLATAGGTTVVDLSAGGSQAAILAALNGIRQTVVTTTTTPITTTTTIETKLDCQWRIPAPTDGETFDKTKVNVEFTPAGGAALPYGWVAGEADCAGVGDGWYYDDNAVPTEIRVCSRTCDTIKASTGGRVDLKFGCERIPAEIH